MPSAKPILPCNVSDSQVKHQGALIIWAGIMPTTGRFTNIILILEQLISSSCFEDKLQSMF